MTSHAAIKQPEIKRPVLDATRAILKFKDQATVSEIARYCDKKYRDVLDVLNRNSAMISRNRKTGHVTKVDPVSFHREVLRKSGRYYFPDTYGAWSVEGRCLRFDGYDELKKTLQEVHWTGGIGDSWRIAIVKDTPENRAALEKAGLRLWSDDEANESLWVEP